MATETLGEHRGGRGAVPEERVVVAYPPELYEEEDSFQLLSLVNVLLRRRWLIFWGTLALVALAILYSKLQTPVYEASARFLPSRTQDMSARIDASFGVGRGSVNPYTEDTRMLEYFSQVLSGTTFIERIARKTFTDPRTGESVDLVAYYDPPGRNEEERLLETVQLIQRNLRVSAPGGAAARRAGTVMGVTFAASDPVLAAQIANAVLDELIHFTLDVQGSKASENRLFIEQRLEETQVLLQQAEVALARFEQGNRRIVTPEPQVELNRLNRNLRVQEELFVTLKKQLELARIAEQENRATIEVVQRALPPRSRSRPSIRKNAMIAGFLGLVLFCGLALVLEMARKFDQEDEETREFLKNVKDIRNDAARVGRLVGIGRSRNG
jgi:uncharacterized protein involved in exopolysaccharide biosynthesis